MQCSISPGHHGAHTSKQPAVLLGKKERVLFPTLHPSVNKAAVHTGPIKIKKKLLPKLARSCDSGHGGLKEGYLTTEFVKNHAGDARVERHKKIG